MYVLPDGETSVSSTSEPGQLMIVLSQSSSLSITNWYSAVWPGWTSKRGRSSLSSASSTASLIAAWPAGFGWNLPPSSAPQNHSSPSPHSSWPRNRDVGLANRNPLRSALRWISALNSAIFETIHFWSAFLMNSQRPPGRNVRSEPSGVKNGG